MKRLQVLPLLFGLFFGLTAGGVNAQAAGDKAGALTRAQVKMEREEFLKSFQYDPGSETWVMKPGAEAPSGMKSRAEVKAARDEFLRNNRWDGNSGTWVSLKGAPRDISKLTREQVRDETRQFVRTHSWDSTSETWVDKATAKKK